MNLYSLFFCLFILFIAPGLQAITLIESESMNHNLFLDIDTQFERQDFNSPQRSWQQIIQDIKKGSPYRVSPFSKRDIARFTVTMRLNNLSGNEGFAARFKMVNFRDVHLYVIQNHELVYQSLAFSQNPLRSLSGLGIRDDIKIPHGESTIILTWSGFNVGVFSNLTIWEIQDSPEKTFQFMSLVSLGIILGLSFYHLLLAVSDRSLISLCYACYGIPVVTLFLAYQGIITEIFGVIDVYGRIYCICFLVVSAAIVWLIFLLLDARLYLKYSAVIMKIYTGIISVNVLLFLFAPLLAIYLFEPLLTLSWFMFVGLIVAVGIQGVSMPTYFVYLWCPIMAVLGALTIFSSLFQDYYSQELSYILLCADFIVMSLLLSSRVGRARESMALSIENERFVGQLSGLLREKVMPKAKLLEGYGNELIHQGMATLGASLSQEAARFQGSVMHLDGGSFKWDSQKEVVLLEDFFQNIQQQFQYLAAQKNLELRLDLHIKVSKTVMDKRALEHVVINLLSNAIRYTDKGQVKLRATLKKGVLTIEVSDTGPGVSVSVLPNLFKPFSSLANTKHSSHGLGLYICHKVLNSLGGSIRYEQKSGSLFTVLMPVEKGK